MKQSSITLAVFLCIVAGPLSAADNKPTEGPLEPFKGPAKFDIQPIFIAGRLPNIVVTLNMDTYYASVNEAGTPLSEASAALLEREDVPGFFSACGPYYVRGINRNSQFVSLFTYETTEEKRDYTFEAALKGEVQGFFGGKAAEAAVQTTASFGSHKAISAVYPDFTATGMHISAFGG